MATSAGRNAVPGADTPSTEAEEQAALEELQRLQRALEESRSRRRQAADAFDTFVKSFEQPGAAASSAEPAGRAMAVAWRSEADGSEGDAILPLPRGPRVTNVTASAVEPGQGLGAFAPESEHPLGGTSPTDKGSARPPSQEPAIPVSAARRWSAAWRWLAAGVLIIVFYGWFASRTAPVERPEPQAAAGSEVGSPAGPPAAAAPPVVEAPAPPGEIVTSRRVWVRVLVNGSRTVERELAAGVRVPLPASSEVVIRTGDAGALRVLIGGKDQGTLGRDGIVVTRTFTVK
jgi:hypothetical protein